MNLDPQRELYLERDVDLPPSTIWKAWTTPELIRQWFCPRPWKVVECELDLRPGGIFRTVMQSPEGKNLPSEAGSYLAVETERRLVWTNALGPDYRLQPKPPEEHLGFFFVVDLRLEPLPGGGTRYRVRVNHQDEAARQTHANMGFEQGWGIALDQLVELMKTGGVAAHP